MNKKKVNIGFDIGITSVGWAIVDEDNNIIDRGVRLFNELKDPKDGSLENENRRSKRALRRLIRRKRNRKDDFIKLVTNKYIDIFKVNKYDEFEETKANFIKNILLSDDNNVIDLILKGLNQEILPSQLLRVLYYYLSHRGYSYKTMEMLEKEDHTFSIIQNNSEYLKFADWLLKNSKLSEDNIEQEASKYNFKNDFQRVSSFRKSVKNYNNEKDYYGLFPTQVQKKLFEKHEYFRGNEKNTSFSTHEWWKEINQLLLKQSYINNEFIKDYEELFFRKRKFSDGPGSEKSPSDYGLFRVHKDTGNIEKVANRLWDLTIGKCSVYPEESRADKKSISAELSNIISQLNTLIIKDNKRTIEKLTENEKKEIIFWIISKNKNLDLKIISNIVKCLPENIFHYPTKAKKSSNKENDDCNFDEMSNSKKLFKELGNYYKLNSYDDFIDNLEKLNSIVHVFACYPDQPDEIKNNLLKEGLVAKEIIDSVIRSKIDSQQTSSMSLKVLNEFIKEEIVDKGKTVNQKYKSIIDKNEADKFNFEKSNSKYIDINCMNNEILSPTTKCSFRETLKVFNKIIKKYIYNGQYYLKNIVMEMPTEWNTVDQEKRITDIKNANESLINKIKENYGYEAKNSSDKIFRKLSLLLKQNGKDIYTNEFIDPNKVIRDDRYCDIDHIVPYSMCYDDSWHNKVLTLTVNNAEKGQRTPKQYLGSKFHIMEKHWRDLYLDGEYKDKRKYEMLTMDLSLDENSLARRSIGFIGRNLADTRYACRLVNQAFRAWLTNIDNKVKNLGYASLCPIGDEIHLININGSTSQKYRGHKYLDFKKDREIDHSHHAIDATICAILGNSNTEVGKLVWYQYVNPETLEVSAKSKYYNDNDYKKMLKYDNDIDWSEKLKNDVKNHKVKFSFKLQKKTNMQLWGDSLISVRKDTSSDKYIKYSKVEFLKFDNMNDVQKEMNNLIELYGDINNSKYHDKKMWEDILKAYYEGLKLAESSKESSKLNPFRVYMDKYYEIHDIEKPSTYTHLILERNNYKYKVKSIKKYNIINSFYPTNSFQLDRMNNNLSFGAKTKLEWKEIRLYKDKKGKYKIIPIRIDVLQNNLKNFNEAKINKLLQFNNIDINSTYFVIHYGTLMLNKNDSNDLRKIVGGNFKENKLDIQEVYKKSKQNQVAISTIMANYNFCTVDVLGNVSVIKEEDIFKKEGL